MSTLCNLTLAEMSAWSVKFLSLAPTLTVPFAVPTEQFLQQLYKQQISQTQSLNHQKKSERIH